MKIVRMFNGITSADITESQVPAWEKLGYRCAGVVVEIPTMVKTEEPKISVNTLEPEPEVKPDAEPELENRSRSKKGSRRAA